LTEFWHLFAAATLCVWLLLLADSVRAFRAVTPLPPDAGGSGDGNTERHPLVSVIVTAKEEELHIADTIRHLLDQTYPRMEIIAINDRSRDKTGLRLEQLKEWSQGRDLFPIPLRVIHITHLPRGWLGKNHALYQGYLQARGKYLLFTDADVLFHPDTIRAAVTYMQQHEIDHLTLAPALISRSFPLQAFVHMFIFCLNLAFRPWRSNLDARKGTGMGIGAFNLITRNAYETIGTHKAIAMCPDDDLQLGKRVRQFGLRQRILLGSEWIRVKWYANLGEAIRGMEKNVFSGFGYRISLVIAALAAQWAFFLVPFVAVWWIGGWPRFWYMLSIAIMLALYVMHTRRFTGESGTDAVLFPINVLLFGYVIIRSVALILIRRGMYWRGTFYSVKELKKMRKP